MKNTHTGGSFTKETFWKNFNLGTELDIAGIFIYNGIESLDKIEFFDFTPEIFEVLYNLAVGIERLQKVLIIFTEYDKSPLSQEEFEKSLITHNHSELMARIRNKHKINLNNPHNEFLTLLSSFYKKMRYDRFNINVVYDYDKEKTVFLNYITKSISGTEFLKNSKQIKKFIGNILKKIVSQLFELVIQEASRLNLFTNELKYDSKAARIFWASKFDLSDDNIYRKEILFYLIERNSSNNYDGELTPLNLETWDSSIYVKALFDNKYLMQVKDEIDVLYEKIKNKKERMERISNLEYGLDFDAETISYELPEESEL